MSSIAQTLDRSSFSTDVRLVALKIPAKACNDYLHTFSDALFRRPKMKKVYDAPDSPSERLVLLAEQYQDLSLQDLPEELAAFNKKHDGKAQEYILHLGYEHLGADEVLRRILPATVKEVPSAFEQAGHLAHLNLREEALPYKHLIAQVLLDKNPTIKTVVNKIGNIETEFRTFPMEVRQRNIRSGCLSHFAAGDLVVWR
jgi:tRNA (guanine37-N1)-methyltransferase